MARAWRIEFEGALCVGEWSQYGCGFPCTPRTDLGVRHYRTGLLPQVIAPKRTVAAWRTRSSALATPARHWVRCVFYPNRFPLANPLPSTASADSFEPLFGDFFGSMALSDFPCSFITGVCPQTSQCSLLPPWLRANMGSPGSRVRCFHTELAFSAGDQDSQAAPPAWICASRRMISCAAASPESQRSGMAERPPQAPSTRPASKPRPAESPPAMTFSIRPSSSRSSYFAIR